MWNKTKKQGHTGKLLTPNKETTPEAGREKQVHHRQRHTVRNTDDFSSEVM